MRRPIHRWSRGAVFLLIPFAVVGIVVAATHMPTSRSAAAATSTEPDPAFVAKDVFVRAVTLLQTVGVPPNASVDRVPTADDIQNMEDEGRSELDRLFTSAAVGEGMARLATAAQIASSDVRALGGGVSRVTYDSATANNDGSYSISAHVTAWAKLAQVLGGHAAIATPSNVLIVNATLVPSGSSYVVGAYSWKYAPGSAP